MGKIMGKIIEGIEKDREDKKEALELPSLF